MFISYDHDDASYVHGVRGVLENSNHHLDFDDRSLREPVLRRDGYVNRLPPSDPAAEPVRKRIRELFDLSSRMLVLVGWNTHSSQWVNWEIEEFARRKSRYGHHASNVIFAKQIRETRGGAPAALGQVGIWTVQPWNLDALAAWLRS